MKYLAFVLIALPLVAEAFVWKWLAPRDRPEDIHPDLQTHADRWYDYMRQGRSAPIQSYHGVLLFFQVLIASQYELGEMASKI